MPKFKEADLIDFHCLHHEAFSYMALPALTAAKPAVFTFHDMWPLIFKLISQINNHLEIGNHQSSLNFVCSGAPTG